MRARLVYDQRKSTARRLSALVPADLAGLVDLKDPDLEYITVSAEALRDMGLDVADPEVFKLAVELGSRRAAASLDDVGLQPEVEAELEAELIRGRWEAAYFAQLAALGPSRVVYYMRTGNRCKIGFTGDIRQRFQQLTAEQLLVVEPGGYALEKRRHRKFGRLRTSPNGEWFRYEDALVTHVRDLQIRQMQGSLPSPARAVIEPGPACVARPSFGLSGARRVV